MEVVKEGLCVNKLIVTKKEIMFVEGDMIVPDSKPDILNTICTSGVVCLYKKELLDDKIKLDGGISAYIMYLTDDTNDRVRGLNVNVDFSESINLPNVTSDMQSRVVLDLKSIEGRIINGRKIAIKASLDVLIEVYSKNEIEIINDIQNESDLQMLREELKVNSLVGTGETKIYAKETISIDSNDNLAEILKVKIGIGGNDVKISYNKILTKAEADVMIMYLTEDGRINKVNVKIPIVGFIDMPNVDEQNISEVFYEIKNIIIKPNSVDEHSIYVEMEIGAMAICYEEKTINLIQDLYSPCNKLECNKRQIGAITELKKCSESKQLREKMNVEGFENKSILEVDVVPYILEEKHVGTKVMSDCEFQIIFMLLNNSGEVEMKQVKLPFDFVIEDVENLNTKSEIEVVSHDFVVDDLGSVEANIDMMINTSLYRDANLNIIDNIENVGEREEQDYGLVLYIVQKGDTLWSIAKKFGSTIDDIVRTNGIENSDKIYPNDKIFIPRYVKSSKSNLNTSVIEYV